jgi:hypothetical protein
MENTDLIIINRDTATLYPNDEEALTFIKPYSGEWENHLIVIYEDAYGDHGTSMLHRKTISEKYRLDDETITAIFNQLNNGNN